LHFGLASGQQRRQTRYRPSTRSRIYPQQQKVSTHQGLYSEDTIHLVKTSSNTLLVTQN